MATEQKIRIAFDDIGIGGPSVVLLHGMFANRSYYAAQAQHRAAQHRVLSIDLRGHSFPVALKVVLRRPDLAAGLVMLDGAVLLPEVDRQRLAGLVQVLQTDQWRNALLGFFGHVAAGATERVRADTANVPRVYAAPLLSECGSSDFASDLLAVRCPILYVQSNIPTDLDRLRSLRPDAVVETIPEAGHYVMLTAPDKVNAALDRFLRTVA